MVYGNCPHCNAPYDRQLPCECDLKLIAQKTPTPPPPPPPPTPPPTHSKNLLNNHLTQLFSCFFIK